MKPLLSLLLAFGCIACPSALLTASSADKEAPEASEADEKRNTTVIEVEASMEAAHDAAAMALAKIGCKIKKDKADYLEGKRPNKVGLAVGSGGEKLFVWIESMEEGKVRVTVKTKKTMVGVVGQKLWNEDVAAEIMSELGAS